MATKTINDLMLLFMQDVSLRGTADPEGAAEDGEGDRE